MRNDTSKTTRRDSLKWLLGSGLAALLASVFYPVIAYLKPPRITTPEVTSVNVGTVSELSGESSTVFRFGNKPVILIRTPDDTYKAFAATCTHLDCTVQYREDMGMIWCACHNGKYDLDGRNISGPPPKPLEEFIVVIKDDEVHVSKS